MPDNHLKEFEQYALDHIEHFGALPVEFEIDDVVYDIEQCWVASEKLDLIKKIS